jgi:hypothetical protein
MFRHRCALAKFVKVKNVKQPILFKETLLRKSSKMDGLGTTAGETNVVYSGIVPDYLLNRLLDDLGSTSKEEFAKAFVLYITRSEKCI